MFGFYRVAAAVPPLHLANPGRNLDEILPLVREAHERGVAALVLPELIGKAEFHQGKAPISPCSL